MPPKQFDEYRLVKALGRGSMGQVWLAHDTLLDRLVAVKFLTELAAHDAVRQRFLTEARAAARVQHPNVIAIYRVGEIGARPYLISEYVRGDSLDHIVRPVAWPRLHDIAIGLARGLAAAHQRGVLHRDLKPANAILARTGEVKLLDFGLAKLVRHGAAGDARDDAATERSASAVTAQGAVTVPIDAAGASDDARNAQTIEVADGASFDAAATTGGGIALPQLTRAGALMGTPAYMPPEAWRGEPATARSDVYSLGALLYELAGGVPPHRGDSQDDVRDAALASDAAPLANAVPGIDARFAAIVDRCLRRAPGERFASGDEVREALEALAAGERAAEQVGSRAGDGRSRGRWWRRSASAPGHRRGDGDRRSQIAGSGDPDGSADGAEGSAPRGTDRRSRRWPRAAGAVVAAVAVFAVVRLVGHRPGRGRPRVAEAAAREPCPVDMVAVPAGAFQMGSTEGSGDADERPRHTVTLSPYCIDRTEVTVAAYAACAAAGACLPPPLTVNWPSYSVDDVKRFSAWCNRGDRPDHPINCIDWGEAVAYCAWKERRLPTEAEWEYAARGHDDRIYPWGNEPPTPRRLNACGGECASFGRKDGIAWKTLHGGDDGWPTTAPVGSYPAGASRFGALDMAGNVWEWTADWYGAYTDDAAADPQGPPSGTSRISRGGGWSSGGSHSARAADRDWFDPAVREAGLGFRCARAN